MFNDLWQCLQDDFPKLKFFQCENDDSNIMRDVSNTANLLGWLYCFNEFIWKWDFKEFMECSDKEILDKVKDNSYRNTVLSQQESWVYKNIDVVFGFPTIVRFSQLKCRKIMQSVVYIHWINDKLTANNKSEHLRLVLENEKNVFSLNFKDRME